MTATTLPTPFDPARYLRKLNGKDYLEVVYRVQWLRSEHPEAIITSELTHLDFEKGWVTFHARVEVPGGGVAEADGSETRDNFPSGWYEKAQTVAIGRALALLGYGTAFAVADFEEGHPADSPVERSAAAPAPQQASAAREPRPIASALATPAQLKLIYLTATRDVGIDEQELEARCQERYGRLPLHLTKREASEFIDSLKGGKQHHG